jgi:deoxyadenosine/deoxycytidine kinase
MLIVIEGCVGVGKSTVAKGLAAFRHSNLLLEEFEMNPFLRAFYRDPVENATETEFAFLLLHFHQLKGQTDTASRSEVISDFHLGKDLLYADLNLKEVRARRVFSELYELCLETAPPPALVIFLSASTDLVLSRIRGRERDFELEIDPGYYSAVNAAYEDFFKRYSGKKIRVPMDEWDFVKNPALYNRLAALVDGELNIK